MVVQLQVSSPGWNAIPGLSCGEIGAIAVDPQNPDNVLAASPRVELFTSNDGGQSFQRHATPLGDYDIARDFAFTSSDRVYMALSRDCTDDDGGGVWASDDRGATWAPTALQNVDLSHWKLSTQPVPANGSGQTNRK